MRGSSATSKRRSPGRPSRVSVYRLKLDRAEELRHRGSPRGLVTSFYIGPYEAARPLSLRELDQAVELCARELAGSRIQATDHTAPFQRAPEDLELGVAQRIAEIADLEPEARVGAIRSVALDRLRVGDPRERRLPTSRRPPRRRPPACFR